MNLDQMAKLGELALNDSTVHAHLKMMARDGDSWETTLFHLTMSLAQEKEMYRKALIRECSLSTKPLVFMLPKQ